MGGRVPSLNRLARQLWQWCENRNIWISPFHIPGKMNIRADKLSRNKKCNEDMEWALEQEIYEKISCKMGASCIDLFASAKNHKHRIYVSYMPEKGAYAINAFSITWIYKLHYVFPPFSVIGRIIQNMCEDQAELILVAPIFPSQLWFPQVPKRVSGPSYVLPKTDQILYLPGQDRKHRLTSMRMGAFRLSGNASLVQDYQQTLQISSCSHGDLQQQKQYGTYLQRWVHFCHRQQVDKINPFLGDILSFLTRLHDDGLSYSAINTAKSMLSSIFEIIHKRDIGKEVLVKRFMKGIFHVRPLSRKQFLLGM